MRIGKVDELFDIRGRGVVVVTDVTNAQLPKDLRLKVGDPVEFRVGGQPALRSITAGIEHCDPWSPQRPFAFVLPADVAKEMVPAGSEVWSVE
jgi:hypothetical protein